MFNLFGKHLPKKWTPVPAPVQQQQQPRPKSILKTAAAGADKSPEGPKKQARFELGIMGGKWRPRRSGRKPDNRARSAVTSAVRKAEATRVASANGKAMAKVAAALLYEEQEEAAAALLRKQRQQSCKPDDAAEWAAAILLGFKHDVPATRHSGIDK